MRQHSQEHWKAVLQYKGVVMPRIVAMMMSMVLCFSMSSCDLFKTRTPQEPTQSSSNRIPPTDPEKVLQNMIDAFHDKNTENYLYSLSSVSFTFEATANAQRNFGSTFLAWDKSSEHDYFAKLIIQVPQNSFITLKFDSMSVDPTATDSSQGDTYYNLTIPFTGTNPIKNFRGRAQFMFARDQNGLWFIRRWLDIGLNASDSTWSDLKGAFAQ
jgi:hypothetical protein